MPALFRAGLFAALFVFVTTPSPAAEKTFQDAALDDAAITLAADLKDAAGTIAKPIAALKQEADALASGDLAGAANIYAQIVTVAPNDASSWRRLAELWLLIPVTEEDDGSTRTEQARTAAYIAYQRATTPEEKSASLATLANAFTKREEWRQALNALKVALTLNETPELRRAICVAAREIRLPHCELQRGLGRRIAARLLPVLRASSQAHRLLAVRRGFRPGQAGALGR